MITLIEALNYRCLKYVQRPLNPFHVLVGPNASGKTTFLDVIGFLRDLVSKGLDFDARGQSSSARASFSSTGRQVYRQIAEKVSLRRCEDESFLRSKTWFPKISQF